MIPWLPMEHGGGSCNAALRQHWMRKLITAATQGLRGLHAIQPVALLGAVLYVANVCFASDLPKIRDWDTTLANARIASTASAISFWWPAKEDVLLAEFVKPLRCTHNAVLLPLRPGSTSNENTSP